MSRSGYSYDWNRDVHLWRGAVKRALTGKRGQQALLDLIKALDSLPEKKLIGDSFQTGCGVCALGALAQYRGRDVSDLGHREESNYDGFHEREVVAGRLNIAEAMAGEVIFENDEGYLGPPETEAQRWGRMRRWAVAKLTPENRSKVDQHG